VHDIFRGRLAQIDRNASALMQHDGTEIVDAVGLVGMLVGEEHRVDMIDLGVDQLLAQVGRGVDQDSRDSAFPERSTSSEQRRRRFFGFLGRTHPSRARDAERRRRIRSREL